MIGDVVALRAAHRLTETQSVAARTIAHLSSGLRITSAADDPPGAGIAEGWTSTIGALRVTYRGTQDTIGALDVADGAMAQVHDILNQLRTVTVAAMNTSALSAAAASAYATTSRSLLAQIDTIGASTTWAGTRLLDGTWEPYVQLGAGPGDGLVVTGAPNLSVSGLGLTAFTLSGTATVLSSTPGRAAVAPIAGTASTFVVDVGTDVASWAATTLSDVLVNGTRVNLTDVHTSADVAAAFAHVPGVQVSTTGTQVRLTADTVGPTLLDVTGLTGYATAGTTAVPGDAGAGATLVAAVNLDALAGVISYGSQKLNLAGVTSPTGPVAPSTLQQALAATFTTSAVHVSDDGTITLTAAAGGGTFAVTSDPQAVSLGLLEEAISATSRARAHLGAMRNRLDHATRVQADSLAQATASRSRLVDGDVAQDVLEYTRASLLMAAGAALVAQALAVEREHVLALLR